MTFRSTRALGCVSSGRLLGLRSFHISSVVREAGKVEATKRQATFIRESAKQEADAWLKRHEDRYKHVTTAVYVGGKDTPFPMNPFFKPKPPISDATRSAIYALYEEDPHTWTPRLLATRFGLSIVRVQAVIRLKALEAQWKEQNKPLQTELRAGMERFLKADTIEPKENQVPREKLRSLPAKRLNPFFRMMNEEEVFTPEDAAALMKMEPYANLQRKLDEAADHTVQLAPEKETVAPAAINEDSRQGGRHQFMVVDTGNLESKTKVLVRDTTGRLRPATAEERFRRTHQRPKFTM
ncbi:eukaryotic mitochondrial regulator protein-domain-containing protein [Gaertneriomyces semiglobifer]|nr:eukaryotic mitochondrial regulator protein-domain-containing protein [Gaertneriomyces semiglobifer]